MKRNKSIIDRYFDYMRIAGAKKNAARSSAHGLRACGKCGAEVLHLTCAVEPDDSMSLSIGAIGGC